MKGWTVEELIEELKKYPGYSRIELVDDCEGIGVCEWEVVEYTGSGSVVAFEY